MSVINHVLVSKHLKLSKKDRDELFSKYNITIKELPKILSSDPALAGLNVEVGDVIKIERKSPTSGIAVFYRGVING